MLRSSSPVAPSTRCAAGRFSCRRHTSELELSQTVVIDAAFIGCFTTLFVAPTIHQCHS
ncbi:hypothetical protein L195_g018546 [Trifolium pratense]|uniref:Uncharacterized protein n=1 Tax=Trifolium pratense TaxID=57577 RepID=A0A2K3MX30_TRIPR|nr:hypothetical protein L195_g049154 [Trifolium pratense]PNX95355.1 hypothetical protein L195_g018546 [Trifolium pratense]